MKAVVKYGKGTGLVEIREVPEPKIKDDEVLIDVKAVSVCGSDLHIYHDSHPLLASSYPRV
jgi:threonine dehydrogenase-like Zn-dependent dehydrogenase